MLPFRPPPPAPNLPECGFASLPDVREPLRLSHLAASGRCSSLNDGGRAHPHVEGRLGRGSGMMSGVVANGAGPGVQRRHVPGRQIRAILRQALHQQAQEVILRHSVHFKCDPFISSPIGFPKHATSTASRKISKPFGSTALPEFASAAAIRIAKTERKLKTQADARQETAIYTD